MTFYCCRQKEAKSVNKSSAEPKDAANATPSTSKTTE